MTWGLQGEIRGLGPPAGAKSCRAQLFGFVSWGWFLPQEKCSSWRQDLPANLGKQRYRQLGFQTFKVWFTTSSPLVLPPGS